MSKHDLESQNGSRSKGQDLSVSLLSSGADTNDDLVGKTSWKQTLSLFAIDLIASIPFWYAVAFWFALPTAQYYMIGLVILAIAALSRVCRSRASKLVDQSLPYPMGYFVDKDGRELYLVATVHISPRSCLDTTAVINKVKPDVVMIELDDERLDTLRAKEPEPPKQDDLQLMNVTGFGVTESFGQASANITAQRAIWNAEKCGEKIRGDIFFDEMDPHGLRPASEAARGKILLVRRGPSDGGAAATFSVKCHNAARGGAVGIVVIGTSDQLPERRLGMMSGDLCQGLNLAYHTRSLGFPPVPLVMTTSTDGEKLLQLATSRQDPPLQLECQVMADHYPRRTLKRGLCQMCLLYSTGVGILYGVVRCFQVEVGGEFTAAEQAASEHGVPCACIDVDMNRLWSRLLSVTKPTPSNVARVVWSWLAVPRVVFGMLFPQCDRVDNLGSMVLHAKSFPVRNWLAFAIAGCCASFVSTTLLNVLSAGITDAAVDGNALKQSSADDFQAFLLNAVMLYLLPCLYEAILASRDEAMYRGICSQARSLGAKRMVAVTGAAHTNGILQRCRERGI